MIELLAVIAIIGVLAALLIPAVGKAKSRAKAVECASNLRQIGIASTAFAHDNEDRFPAEAMFLRPDRFASPYEPLLAILKTRGIFICPADVERAPGDSLTALHRTNTSYFASYTARPDHSQSILAGDRNLLVNGPSHPGFPNGMMARQTGRPLLYRTNVFGWWRDIHQLSGNLLLTDGGVHRTRSHQFTALTSIQPEASFVWNVPNGDRIFTPYP